MIKEEQLQFIWEKGLLKHYDLKTTGGIELNILSTGILNFNAGPDFFNASIKIGSTVWAGNVELHLKSSDWEKHGHHKDGAYNNVILHVVLQEDAVTVTSLGRRVDTLLLGNIRELIPLCREAQSKESYLPCHAHICNISNLQLRQWLTKLQSERLEQKCMYISDLRKRSDLNWEETLLMVMASAIGKPLNSLPFEMTLKAIPIDLLVNNRDNLQFVEAMLFGQAGFLNAKELKGTYHRNLYRIHASNLDHLKSRPVNLHMWKFLRLRPASFPTLRISQYASLIQSRFPLLDSLLNVASYTELEQLLRVESSSYWDTHYLFGKCSPESKKVLGQNSIRTLILNGLVPFLFTFGQSMNHLPAIIMGNQLLDKTALESNHIIKKWAIFGIKPRGAFEGQALIQLHNNYCKRNRCPDCLLGAEFNKK